MKKIFFLILFLYSNSIFATKFINQFNLTLINQTQKTFHFTHLTHENPGNVFIVNSNLLPGQTASISGETSDKNDLAGSLYFQDDTGKESILSIIDYRQFHVGQSIFSMSGDTIFSTLISKTLNPDINPKALMYSAATIKIVDR